MTFVDPFFLSPHNKDWHILGSILGPLIHGNYQICLKNRLRIAARMMYESLSRTRNKHGWRTEESCARHAPWLRGKMFTSEYSSKRRKPKRKGEEPLSSRIHVNAPQMGRGPKITVTVLGVSLKRITVFGVYARVSPFGETAISSPQQALTWKPNRAPKAAG